MKIALDAMGGDFAPGVTVKGAVEVVRESENIDIVLVGAEPSIAPLLKAESYPPERISVYHASEVIQMDASPSQAIRRKKDSSVRKAVELVRDGVADAAVSAGNSGAMMALAMYLLGKTEGVERPAIAAVMPSLDKSFLMLDAGANVDCSPENLLQFAFMGNAYAKHVMLRSKPKVAILSIGEEPSKGNELTKESFKLLENTDLNFIGNIESKDVYLGHVDVVVCDGFVGNIFLKTSEGLADVVMKILKREISASMLGKLGYLMMRPAIRNFKKITDYDEYGGAPLLGLKGACIISHGRSSSKAIKNAVFNAAEFASKTVSHVVADELSKVSLRGKTVVTG